MNLDGVNLPDWVAPAAQDLIQVAETTFAGPKQGKARKRFVKQALKAAAREIDVPGVPKTIENAVLDLVIEIVFALTLGKKAKKGKKPNPMGGLMGLLGGL